MGCNGHVQILMAIVQSIFSFISVRVFGRKFIMRKEFDGYLQGMKVIEQTVKSLIGLASLIQNPRGILSPDLMKKNKNIMLLNQEMDEGIGTFEAFALELCSHDERRNYTDDSIIPVIRRSLLADASEFSVDTICRLFHMCDGSNNPYQYLSQKKLFDVKFRDVTDKTGNKNKKSRKGGDKPADIFSREERQFWKFIAGLRHCIRHNNSVVLPGKCFEFKGELFEEKIDCKFKWVEKKNNGLKLKVGECYKIFKIMRKVTEKFYSEIIPPIG